VVNPRPAETGLLGDGGRRSYGRISSRWNTLVSTHSGIYRAMELFFIPVVGSKAVQVPCVKNDF
jgi:hypothetical protein